MMRVVLLTACSANVVAFLQPTANQADDATGAEGHADERAPSNDAPTSRSLMFATVPQKMTYSSDVRAAKRGGAGSPPLTGSGYINPCPSSHPFLEKYSTWDAY